MGFLTASQTWLRTALAATALVAALIVSQARATTDGDPVILVVGDSLSAAYGLAESEGWVQLAKAALQPTYPDVAIVNASISGDTTAGGIRRLPAALERFQPDLVIIELGGNDGLRAYSVDAMRNNLTEMAKLAREAGAETLILGMMIPSNYGPAYTEAFAQAFVEAADLSDSGLVPFFLEPIALDRNYFQRDGIHPNAEAQPLMLQHVLPSIEAALQRAVAN